MAEPMYAVEYVYAMQSALGTLRETQIHLFSFL